MIYTLRNCRYTQYIASLSACTSISIGGLFQTWPSPTLPILTSDESPFGKAITDEQGSWITSLFLLTTAITVWFLSWPIETLGRKTCLLISALPMFFGWLCILFGNSVYFIYVGRIFGGVGLSISNVVVTIYIGEIAEKDIRGKLGTFFSLLKLSGQSLVLCVGPFVSYTTLNLICTVAPAIFFLLFLLMPESPYFLIKRGRKAEAWVNLVKLSSLNATKEEVDRRLLEIEVRVQHDMKNKSNFWMVFTEDYRFSLIVILMVKTLQQFSGVMAVDSYFQTIISQSTSSISPQLSSALYGLVQIVAVLLSASFVDKIGRKPLLVISSLGCALALLAEGIYFYLQENLKMNVGHLFWLPTSSLVFFGFMINFGVATLPYVLLTELFATNVKEIASIIGIGYGSILAFVVAKFFKPLSNDWGMYSLFWFFSGVCFLGAVFVYFILPETKGKTLHDVQVKLANRKMGKQRMKTEL